MGNHTKYNLQVPSAFFFCLVVYCCCSFPQLSDAAATTDPKEVEALKVIASKMKISKWDFSLDPCKNDDSNWYTLDDALGPRGVMCNCEFEKNTTCHAVKLIVVYEELQGIIPPELANLTYLQSIDLRFNYLSGSIPATIGSLSRLEYMSLGQNRLTGQIPKELGNLTKLISLSFEMNSLSGTLPPELGNLTNLERFYMRSNQISGTIPTTFSKLKKLQVFWASSNNFTGKLPDLIGNWTQLEDLKLEGTSFEGPIPSTLSNLTKLTSLIICDLPNGGTSLPVLPNLKNLKTLFLRNNNISGQIPEYIGKLDELQMLDLSFNNLRGQIPDSLRNLSSLKYLFLGSNNLTGPLPSWLNVAGRKIDLSYNNFSGLIPTWYNDYNLTINLIGNFLESNATNQSSLACLQRSFPCHKGKPKISSLAINCGGPKWIDSSTRVTFESDNEVLSSASFYMNSAAGWGVSSVGFFVNDSGLSIERSDQYNYTANDNQNISIYQTARLSPLSLRYYGLGLENGVYNVELHFDEIQIPSGQVWRSLGSRFFDVFVQGTRKLRDFNIKETAGDSNVAIKETYNVSVTENVLDVHLFWAGKGTFGIPSDWTRGPLVSAIRVTPGFKATIGIESSSNNNRRTTGIIIGVIVGVGVLLCLFLVLVRKRRRNRKFSSGYDSEDFKNMAGKAHLFSLSEMKIATKDFDIENKIGEGGFGAVYKGVLQNGNLVAVKKLSSTSGQGKREFLNEVATISAVQHRNLVKLCGCCIEDEQRLLVFEYMPNNSLGQALFGSNRSKLSLDWPIRFNICLEVARGLAYLHEESRIRIIHRDIKPNNILLDEYLNPKIADFGLARLYDAAKSHISTRVAGTIGYLAPEYALRGHLTEKADVFSFGVVALEVASNRSHEDRNLPDEMVYLLDLAWQLYEEGRLLDLVDTSVLSTYSAEEVIRVIHVALLCTQATPTQRPSMSQVVAMLGGAMEINPPQCRPGYIKDWQLTGQNGNTTSRGDGKSWTWSMSLTMEGRSENL
ncbi:probable LRR receptor-like serine/threonine-protein kinase At1g56140 isoform X1 [Cryptomeria japonica]|uniref:probable LRR receptor-like serine/threonine-protein kinase At1g56140 isoform X1 n=2 Tax=Cryptomeria japonica TaxID=3369 RepID=UPI0025ACE9FF|nr:probable LRR receptor-like serine/threonine-protein kinase At1g56140 isoform X1 [Cryptomeria japonica]